jgi:hypothetical protein
MASLIDPTARGRVILVGAGPGDPGLLTVRAVEALKAADVVIHDGLIDPRVLDIAPPQAQRISVAKKRAHGEQSGVARPGTDENNAPAGGRIKKSCHRCQMGWTKRHGNSRMLCRGVGNLSHDCFPGTAAALFLGTD